MTLLSPHLPSQVLFIRVSYYVLESLRGIFLILGMYFCFGKMDNDGKGSDDGFNSPLGSFLVFYWLFVLFMYLFSQSSPFIQSIRLFLGDAVFECHEQIYYNSSSHISLHGGSGGINDGMSPRSSFPQGYLLVQDGTLLICLQGKVSGSLIRSVHKHRIVLGLKVGVPEVNFKEDGIAYSASQSSADHTQLYGSESRHSQCTNPITEHPA